MGILSRVFNRSDWRDELDAELVNKLEKLLKRTKSYESAYKNADDPTTAQLWVAMAEVYYQQERINARLRDLEERQRQLVENDEDVDMALPDQELRNSLDSY